MKRALAALATLLAGGLPAQVSQTTTFERRVEITASSPGAPPTSLLGAAAALEGKVVKGAPYSAQAVTESLRVLADGTRIVQRTVSKVFRDKEGRTRREYALNSSGELAGAGDALTTVFIHDPVAGALYVLNPADKTARRIRVSIDEQVSLPGGPGEKREVEVIERDAVIPAPAISGWSEPWVLGRGGPQSVSFGGEHLLPVGPDAKEEPLGERIIEGLLVRGTRVTHTIPAGRIGNDRPITIVQERWRSPELDVTVLSETRDPLAADVTYRLTGIQRGDPPPSLFEIPPDYRIEESGVIQRKLRVIEQSVPRKR